MLSSTPFGAVYAPVRSTSLRDIRRAHMFCGISDGVHGFNLAARRVGRVQARFVRVGGVDVDPGAIRARLFSGRRRGEHVRR